MVVPFTLNHLAFGVLIVAFHYAIAQIAAMELAYIQKQMVKFLLYLALSSKVQLTIQHLSKMAFYILKEEINALTIKITL